MTSLARSQTEVIRRPRLSAASSPKLKKLTKLEAAKSWMNSYLTFGASRTCTFHNYKVGLLKLVLLLGLAAYGLAAIFANQGFLEVAVPSALTTVYVTESPSGDSDWDSDYSSHDSDYKFLYSNFAAAQEEVYQGLLREGVGVGYKYCYNPTYDFLYDSSFQYVNSSCIFLDEPEIWSKRTSDAFFKTSASVTHTTSLSFRHRNPAKCTREYFLEEEPDFLGDPEFSKCPLGQTTYVRQGRCICQSSKNVFYPGAENLTLWLDHSYAASKDTLPKIRREGSRPHTVVRAERNGEDYETFEAGEIVVMPLWRWLEVAGVDLDEEVEEPDLLAYLADEEDIALGYNRNGGSLYPRSRLMGVTLDVQLHYVNYKSRPGQSERDRYRTGVKCILTVKATRRWTSLGASVDYDQYHYTDSDGKVLNTYTSEYAYGVKLVFSAHGEVMNFNLFSLIETMTSVFVLVGVVDLIVTLVAFKCLGPMSKLYNNFANEEYDHKHSITQFLIQAMMLRHQYDELDIDGNGTVSLEELRRNFHRLDLQLDEEEIDELVALVMEQMKEQLVEEHSIGRDMAIDAGRGAGKTVCYRDFADFLNHATSAKMSPELLHDYLKAAKRKKKKMKMKESEKEAALMKKNSVAPVKEASRVQRYSPRDADTIEAPPPSSSESSFPSLPALTPITAKSPNSSAKSEASQGAKSNQPDELIIQNLA